MGEWPLQLSSDDLGKYLGHIRETLGNTTSTIVSGAMSATTTIGHVLAGALITLFCLFFFVLEGDRIWHWCVNVFPKRGQERVHQAALRGWITLRVFARMQIIISAVVRLGIGC